MFVHCWSGNFEAIVYVFKSVWTYGSGPAVFTLISSARRFSTGAVSDRPRSVTSTSSFFNSLLPQCSFSVLSVNALKSVLVFATVAVVTFLSLLYFPVLLH